MKKLSSSQLNPQFRKYKETMLASEANKKKRSGWKPSKNEIEIGVSRKRVDDYLDDKREQDMDLL